MKKFLILLVVFGCLMFLKTPFSLSYLSQNYNATHSFYATQNIQTQNTQTIQNGNGYIISTNATNAPNILNKLDKNHIDGESFCIYGTSTDALQILHSLGAVIIKEESFDDFKIIYAHSPKIHNYVLIGNKKINIQIALKNNKITVGTPLILGSY